ncbi:MAG TPA: hypothetical protein VLM43_17080 [Desulfobacterales bacterium]|nr:hypothetical protein [Desulfobacterales bacterium]
MIIHIDAVVTPRQGKLGGKVHLGHRCFALEARMNLFLLGFALYNGRYLAKPG